MATEATDNTASRSREAEPAQDNSRDTSRLVPREFSQPGNDPFANQLPMQLRSAGTATMGQFPDTAIGTGACVPAAELCLPGRPSASSELAGTIRLASLPGSDVDRRASTDDRNEAGRPGRDVTRSPGFEKARAEDGSMEYRVTPGSDARQNARWAQQAIDQARAEGVPGVRLDAGIYRGHIDVKGDNLKITGDTGRTIFDMTGDKSSSGSVFKMQGRNLALDGVTIQNWKPDSGGPVVGVDVQPGSQNVALRNLHIHHLGQDNSHKGDANCGAHAIRVTSSAGKPTSDVSVTGAYIHDMRLGQHEAISFMAQGANIERARANHNLIEKNDNIGIVFEGGSGGKISNFEAKGNIISDARTSGNRTYREASAGAIQVDTNVDGGTISGNRIANSDYGVVLESEKGGTVRGVRVTDNLFVNNSGANVYLDASHKGGLAVDDVTVKGNRYVGSAPMIGKSERSDGIGTVRESDNKPAERMLQVSPLPSVTLEGHPGGRYAQHGNGGRESTPESPGGRYGQHGSGARESAPESARQPAARQSPERRSEAAPESARQSVRTDASDPHAPGRSVRDVSDRARFVRAQTRGNNCLPTAMSMMYADWQKGRPADNKELAAIERITHVGSSGGYRGSAEDIGRQAKQVMPGLQTEAHQGLNRQQLRETLDRHLDAGHTAIVGIKSPYSSNNHYIYVAGKDSKGNYIIGDSGRSGDGPLGKTMRPDDLINRMMQRSGGSRMVAGWMEGAPHAVQPDARPLSRPESHPQSRTEAHPQSRPEAYPQSRPDAQRPGNDRVERTNEAAGLNDRRVIDINGAKVNVSKDLDPTKPIRFVGYFHGWRSTYQQAYKEANMNEWSSRMSPQDVIITPAWQDHEGASNSAHRRYTANGGFGTVLGQAMRAVPELGRQGLAAEDQIKLVGFSAGYTPIGEALRDKRLASRVSDIVLLDSLPHGAAKFVSENMSSFLTGQRTLTVINGAWRDATRAAHAVEGELRKTIRQSGQDPTQHIFSGTPAEFEGSRWRPFTFVYPRGDQHGEFPRKHFGRVNR